MDDRKPPISSRHPLGQIGSDAAPISSHINRDRTGKLALLWPRDAPKWHAAKPQDYRLYRVFVSMAALGIEAEPALYADD